MKTIKLLAFFITGSVLLTSCSDDDNPDPIIDQEVITRVTLTITETGTTNVQTITWNEGDSNPNIVLEPSKSYNVEIGFFDASDPADVENITEEVIELADEHFVFFDNTSSITITNASDDIEDSEEIKIGIKTVWTSPAGTTAGLVRTFLIHEPATKTGDTRTDFGGETDVQVDFNVVVN